MDEDGTKPGTCSSRLTLKLRDHAQNRSGGRKLRVNDHGILRAFRGPYRCVRFSWYFLM